MVIYKEFEEYKDRYVKAQEEYKKIVDERDMLFIKTLPKSTKFDKEMVKGGSASNMFDEYLLKKERLGIDKRLKEAKEIFEDRQRLYKAKKEELMHSKDWYDIIYVNAFIYGLSSRKIERRIPYSKTQISRIIKQIKREIKTGQNGTLLGVR